VKTHTTIYGLVGHVSRVGALVAAALVVVAGSFRGVSGWALALRVGIAFAVVAIVLNLLGYVMIRSLLSAVVASEGDRKRETSGSKRA